MENAELFIDKFKTLENLLRQKFAINDYNKSALREVEVLPQFRSIREDLSYIREIRNILLHKPNINGEYPIQPNEELIKNIENIIEYIKNPPKAYDKCIKINNVCYAKQEDKIYPFMVKMKENVYTHIPILENGVVRGVFSENTLFGALIEDELVYDREKTTFLDNPIYKHCLLDNHVSERFLFVGKETLLEDVRDLFFKYFKNNQRLAMVFVTQNGKCNEKLLGIITPWDVINSSK